MPLVSQIYRGRYQHILTFCIAAVAAIGHFILFDLINGKPADGPDQVISQTWVTTISNILANVFGYSLRSALGVAFIQYLWLLLRTEIMKVSTIELLFSIRSNPFVLIRPAALKAAPVLFALAIIVWASQIVVSFPPGAITVITVRKFSFGNITVPTFNASFVRINP